MAEDFLEFTKNNQLNDKLHLDVDGNLRRYSPTCKCLRTYEGNLVTMAHEDLTFPYKQFSVKLAYRTTEQMKRWNPIEDEKIFSAAETKAGKYAISIKETSIKRQGKGLQAA